MIDHRLHVLRMVAARGTVTGAAEALHYTPSAVSQQLRTPGPELGVDARRAGRAPRPADPRRAGAAGPRRRAVQHAGRRSAAEVAAAGHRAASGRCGCAASPPPRRRCCRRSRRERARAAPGAAVRIIEADPEECFDLLLADEADVAVVVATASLPPSDRPPVRAAPPARGPARPARARRATRWRGRPRRCSATGRRAVDHGPPRSAVPPAAAHRLRRGRLHPGVGARGDRVGHRCRPGRRRSRHRADPPAGAPRRPATRSSGSRCGATRPRPATSSPGSGGAAPSSPSSRRRSRRSRRARNQGIVPDLRRREAAGGIRWSGLAGQGVREQCDQRTHLDVGGVRCPPGPPRREPERQARPLRRSARRSSRRWSARR